MEAVNYLLLYQGRSDRGGHEASIRGFAKLESAQTAMDTAYRSMAAVLNLSAGDKQYTTRAERHIRLERYGDVFSWEIIDAVPEDSQCNVSCCQSGLKQFTVTIEEHISQDFSIRARDFFHAFQIAEDAYREGKMVVEPSAPNTRLMMVRNNKTGEITQWKEF